MNEAPEVIDAGVLNELEDRFLEPVLDVVGAYQVYALEGIP
jgi:hypothetical protein